MLPPGEWSAVPAGLTLEQLEETACLILLGESGSGKTYAMRSEQRLIASQGSEVLAVDLRTYGSEDRLHRDVFAGSQWTTWLAGDSVLWLFIDAWEESLLRLENLAAYLESQLAGVDAARLRLRIAARPLEWSAGLESALIDTFGRGSALVCQLVPLNEDNIRSAAAAAEVNPSAFMSEMSRLGLLPLAGRPITLRFLLEAFRETSMLPATQEQAYAEGLLRLCREPQDTLHRRRVEGGVSEEHVLAAASRIAAVTLLCKKTSVVVDWQGEPLPPEELRIGDIIGYLSETVHDREIEIRERELRVALATGLFTVAGPSRVHWAHQSYAEYLGARYLVAHSMTPAQGLPLIQSAGDPEGKLVPQLHGLAGWLFAMGSPIVSEVLEREPEALVGNGVLTGSIEGRRQLVDALLGGFAENQLELSSDLIRGFGDLCYPGLPDQLRAVITASGAPEASRLAAIRVVIACRISELSDTLAGITLDPSEGLAMRTWCARARIGDELPAAGCGRSWSGPCRDLTIAICDTGRSPAPGAGRSRPRKRWMRSRCRTDL